MHGFALSFAAALAIAAPAAAQAPAAVTLEPGDAASFRIDADGGTAVSAQRGGGQWTAFDVAAARHLSGLPIPAQAVPYATMLHGDVMPAEPPIEPDMVRVKLLSIAGQHSLLVIENGYDRAIIYRARMMRGDRSAPTDVCLVVPRKHGFEHWPHLIDRLEISDMRFVPWREGDPIPCA